MIVPSLALLLAAASLIISLRMYFFYRRRLARVQSELREAIDLVADNYEPQTRIPAKVLQHVLVQVYNGKGYEIEWKNLLSQSFNDKIIWHGTKAEASEPPKLN